LANLGNGKQNKNFCSVCNVTLLNNKRRKSGMCVQCDAANTKRIELIVRDKLLPLVAAVPSATDNAQFGGQACQEQQYRPDLLYADRILVLAIEVDENGGHPDREPSCEVSRMTALTNVFQREDMFGANCHVYFIRFNPEVKNDARDVSLDDRVAALAQRINMLLQSPPPPSGAPTVEYMFYAKKCQKHIDFAASFWGLSLGTAKTARRR